MLSHDLAHFHKGISFDVPSAAVQVMSLTLSYHAESNALFVHRHRVKKILVVLVACVLLLTSCGATIRPATVTNPFSAGNTPTANPNAPPGNFLYTSSVEAMFLAWVNNNGALSGQTQDAQYGTDSNGNTIVNSTHSSFSGTLSNDQVSLNFGGFLGYSNTITGTYSNNTLMLQFPTKDGGVGTFVFVPGTSDEFNTAVSTMQTTANNTNANAAASAATAAAVQSQQQAVTDANKAVSNDLSSLQSYVSSLNTDANFDSVFSGYATDWQSMQNDYQTEVNDSKNGCANGNYGTVQSDAGTVQSDEGSITSDDGSYDSQKASIDGDYSNTQHFISALKSDWQTLQQAVANNASGTSPSNYQQSDIDSAIASGNNALDNAGSVVKKAKQTRATYDNEANNLNNQAQALPGKMGC